jgi:hypothetical protein
MSEKPKRRFFQIHLSTAVVLMFVAGGLMWLNMIQHWILAGRGPNAYGWPYFFYATERIRQPELIGHFYASNLLINVVTAFLGLFVVAAISEAVIRRERGR